MSVSTECKVEENDVIYFIDNCIVELTVNQKCEIDFDNCIEFEIGDKVKFLDWSTCSIRDNQEILIKFADDTGRVFSAVESFFVTEDVWYGLKNYFKQHFAE